MRAPGGGALSKEQEAAANAGLKAMIPIREDHVFLDFVLSGLADAGFESVCLVIGADRAFEKVRARYETQKPTRLSMSIVTQEQPRGSADAVVSAAAFIGNDSFVAMNADNYYPVEVLSALRQQKAPALPAFNREGLLRDGQIDVDRIARYALLEIDKNGVLRRVIEKPDAATFAHFPTAPVSMNCWLLRPRILEACRLVPKSERGEVELPHAVQYAIDYFAARFATFPVDAGVLDLSSRADIPGVCQRLEKVEVRL